jgi:predicted dehydrogenase
MQPHSDDAVSDLNLAPRLPADRSVGIGCIGAGFIMADCHLVAYRQAGFNPVAISSRRPERAREVATCHGIARCYDSYEQLLLDPEVQVLDVAVPPDVLLEVIRRAVRHRPNDKVRRSRVPGRSSSPAAFARGCRGCGRYDALSVNQNMRYDQSVRATKTLLDRGELGRPVLATIDMRAIPHWMPWQRRQGWVTLRIMSIHHLDTLRYWFGDPERVYASVRPDPRTARQFAHEDGIALYILEYADGLRASSWDDVWAGPAREGAAAELGIRYRIEGTDGLALGTIGWPKYPERSPSTLDYTTIARGDRWLRPRWDAVWFPDAFAGPMAELLCSLEEGRTSTLDGSDNLHTMALVEACYQSAREHRAVPLDEILRG